jgi:hypothetical protein
MSDVLGWDGINPLSRSGIFASRSARRVCISREILAQRAFSDKSLPQKSENFEYAYSKIHK